MHCWYPWITICLRSGQAVRGQRPFLIFLGDVCSHYSLDVHKLLSITSLSCFWITTDLDNCCFQLDWTQMTCLKSRFIPDPERFITFSWVNVGIHACLCVYQPLCWSEMASRLMYTPVCISWVSPCLLHVVYRYRPSRMTILLQLGRLGGKVYCSWGGEWPLPVRR